MFKFSNLGKAETGQLSINYLFDDLMNSKRTFTKSHFSWLNKVILVVNSYLLNFPFGVNFSFKLYN